MLKHMLLGVKFKRKNCLNWKNYPRVFKELKHHSLLIIKQGKGTK